MKKLLEFPQVYQAYQCLGGFFTARLQAFQEYLDFAGIHRVFDIGCGPGHVVKYLPKEVDYVGFDTDARYIKFANQKFGNYGRFINRPFDRSVADIYGQPDLILMNGVLHHLDDPTARIIIEDSAAVLSKYGVFFAIDGCYSPGQSFLSRFLLDQDRGNFVRTKAEYQSLAATAFPRVDMYVRDNLSWAPYTFAITKAYKTSTAGSS